MKKLDRINELVDELNELKLGCMAASLDSLTRNPLMSWMPCHC